MSERKFGFSIGHDFIGYNTNFGVRIEAGDYKLFDGIEKSWLSQLLLT
ncbi:MAG: hypothetical protein AB9895_02475 [Negativicutes bacterium]